MTFPSPVIVRPDVGFSTILRSKNWSEVCQAKIKSGFGLELIELYESIFP